MVIKGLFQSNPVKTTHDDWFSRKKTWEDIQEYIPRDKVIWESFMLNSVSSSPQYLQELGFEVEWSASEDFFSLNRNAMAQS